MKEVHSKEETSDDEAGLGYQNTLVSCCDVLNFLFSRNFLSPLTCGRTQRLVLAVML